MNFDKLSNTEVKNALVLFCSRVMDAVFYGSDHDIRVNIQAIIECRDELEKRSTMPVEKRKISESEPTMKLSGTLYTPKMKEIEPF